MNFLWTDFRHVGRVARRSPGVTLAIILLLALGTGGVTTVFNPIYSTLFAPLTLPQPEQLALIGGNIPLFNSLFNRFEREEELSRIFSNLTAYNLRPEISVTMPDTGRIKEIDAVVVKEGFFETLGVPPLRGSDFKNSKERYCYIVSHRFWRNELMGAEDVIGKPLRLALFPIPVPIIGVMPKSFDFPAGTDVWMYEATNQVFGPLRTTRFLGRLRPGLSISRAMEELRTIEFKPGFAVMGLDGPLLQSLHTVISGDRRPVLLMFGSAAILFLLLVCAGVINLLVAQGAKRKSEMALRLILGSTRRNLVFMLLRETLPLVIIGALAGLWISETASAWLMARFPALEGGEVVAPVKMAFFAALVFVVTVIGGLTPALYASGVNLNTYLKSNAGSKRQRFLFSLRELLTGAQLGLALTLLTTIGLLVNSMMFYVDVPIRWSSRDIAVVKVDFPLRSGRSSEAMTSQALFFQEFHDRLSTMSEVASVGIFNPIPFSPAAGKAINRGANAGNNPPGEPEHVAIRGGIEGRTNHEGFEMLGVTLIAGRHFSSADMASEITSNIAIWEGVNSVQIIPNSGGTGVPMPSSGGPQHITGRVVIVNQSVVRQLWPGENAVGKTIYSGNTPYEIIGVVRDIHYVSDKKEFIPVVYFPPDSYNETQTFMVKLQSAAFMNDFRQRLSSLETGSVTIELQPLGEIVSKAMAPTRMTLELLGSFALLGVVVAGLGVYTTTSLMAASWNREMGIRIAVGAQTRDILRLALWRGTRAILFGLPLGLFMAWLLARVLSRYLFHVNVSDPFVWIISCGLMLIITIIAAFIPALRTIRVNPMDVMRD